MLRGVCRDIPIRVFILAGGPGSRLFPFTTFTPKPLMPVAGKPLIVRAMEKLYSEGFNEFVLCVNKNFEDQFNYHMEIWKNRLEAKIAINALENSEELGTAGEIYMAKQYVNGDFMVYYGDILAPYLDVKGLVGFFKSCKGKDFIGTLAVSAGLALEKGVVELGERNIVIKSLKEKPVISLPNWCGIGVFTPEILEHIDVGNDFSLDVLPRVLQKGKRLTAYLFDHPYYDIGSIGSYRRVNELFGQTKLC